MKNAREFALGVAALCLAAAGWVAAQSQESPIGGINQPQTKPASPTTPAADQPVRMNKCSQLIGATVENPLGDRLGKIEEVVVDLDNSRVSYCVLGVEHGIFAATKYLAVPLVALQPSADGSRLVLNAAKEKVAQAQGFDRDNWPPVTNPAWGAQPFWQAAPKVTITTPPDQNKKIPTGTSH